MISFSRSEDLELNVMLRVALTRFMFQNNCRVIKFVMILQCRLTISIDKCVPHPFLRCVAEQLQSYCSTLNTHIWWVYILCILNVYCGMLKEYCEYSWNIFVVHCMFLWMYWMYILCIFIVYWGILYVHWMYKR